MRIACIATSRIPSRSANSIRVMKVCQAIAELDHQVCLWVPGPGAAPPWSSLEDHYGLRTPFEIRAIGAWPPLRRWDYSLRAVTRSRRWDPDLWYVWPYQSAAALSSLGRPTAFEVHDRPAGLTGPVLFRMFLRGRGARRLLVITEALRAWLEVRYGARLHSRFAQVTPSGVDLEAYRDLPGPAQARRRLGWPERFTAGYTGHLYAGRGLELMLELARRNPAVSFVWAGGEPEAVRAWQARLQHDGIGNVRLLGFVPQAELPLVQAGCDALLMPYGRSIAVSSGGDTATFASPMKAFEYLASGRPILSSRLPVFLEVLNPSNAILLEPDAIDAWEAALLRLKADAGERRRLGEAARRDAGRYTWKERTRRALEGLEAQVIAR